MLPLQLLRKFTSTFIYFLLSVIYIIDTYYHNMLPTRQQLPVMCEICCEFFVFQQNSILAQWARTASVPVSLISDFSNGRHPRLFHQACGSSIQIWNHWTIQFAWKFSSGSASEKFTTWTDRHIGMAVMPLSNASSITLQTSGINVSECVFM